MFRIAILGCENSHADNFIKHIKSEYPDKIEVVGVYTEYEDAKERMRTNYGVYVADRFDEFVGRIDGLVVTARHGRDHLRFAEPYFASGIPMFIDKPITASVDDAVKLAGKLRSHNIRFTGGSSCVHAPELCDLKEAFGSGEGVLSGYVSAPINLCNPYGDFWFYSQHLVQIMQSVFGNYPKTVTAKQVGEKVDVLFGYESYNVHATYVDGVYRYNAAVLLADGLVSRELTVDSKVFTSEFDCFYELLLGGAGEESVRAFISPVFIIDAVVRALASGREEQVAEIPAEIV